MTMAIDINEPPKRTELSDADYRCFALDRAVNSFEPHLRIGDDGDLGNRASLILNTATRYEQWLRYGCELVEVPAPVEAEATA